MPVVWFPQWWTIFCVPCSVEKMHEGGKILLFAKRTKDTIITKRVAGAQWGLIPHLLFNFLRIIYGRALHCSLWFALILFTTKLH
mmetsp:Transcript_5306/g.11514  ORF Transcript_5306/g.11514 Transcript_5306/m.11514 type:complete len:85 (-) Transcript_5306:53-307(-)